MLTASELRTQHSSGAHSMPPLRVASTAKRAADSPVPPASGSAKRHKSDAMTAAAMSVAAVAAAISHTAGACTSTTHMHTSPPAPVAPALPSHECPSCFEAYHCDESKEPGESRVPRTLPCAHSACSACLFKQLLSTPGRIRCPTCGDQRDVQLPAGMAAAALSSPASRVRCVPQSSAIIDSIRRSHQPTAMPQQFRAQTPGRCSYPGCAATGAFWCAECAGEMCATHDATWHGSAVRFSHRRLSLVDGAATHQPQQQLQQPKQQQPTLATEAERIRSSAHSALQQRESAGTVQCLSLRLLHAELAREEDYLRREQQKQLMQLQFEQQRQLTQMRADHALRLERATAKVAGEKNSLRQLRDLTTQLSVMGDAEAVAQSTSLAALLRAGPSNQAAASAAVAPLSSSLVAAPIPSTAEKVHPPVTAPVPPPPPTVAPPRPPHASGLLGRGELSDDLWLHLQRFLGADVNLSLAQLLYRGTRDGFAADNLWKRCAGKGPTLTLTKVGWNGYIFGAFTPVSWPLGAANRWECVADPSQRTCLLSLINAHGRPVRLRLRPDESHSALNLDGVHFGPGFGACADVRLMQNRAANQPMGCYVQPASFEVDQAAEAAAGLPPVAFAFDKALLAGDDGQGNRWVEFAAAEIEVYQL